MEFDLIGWGATILGFLVSFVAYIKSVVTKLKMNKAQRVLDNVYNWCIQAEDLFKNLKNSGSLKLQTVLDNALRFCVATNTKYDENKIKKEVEKVIVSTKYINAREKANEEPFEVEKPEPSFPKPENREFTDNPNSEVHTDNIEDVEELIEYEGIIETTLDIIEPATDVVNKILLGGGKQ